MPFARTRTLALLGAVAAVLASPATAQDDEAWPTAEEAARAFKAVCVDNAGDHKAQARAATSAPWNSTKSKDSTPEKAYYDAFPWQFALTTLKDGTKLCSVTTGTEYTTSDAAARTAAIRVLGPRPADIETDDGGFFWTAKMAGKEYLISFQTKNYENDGNPVTVVNFSLAW